MKSHKLLLIFLLLCLIPFRALAAQTGSITIHVPSGGTVTLYHVADLDLTPTPEFSGCTIALTPAAAQALADHARDLPGDTRPLDACFEGLEEGLYLLVQQRAGEGYTPFSPFLISIPTQIADSVYYRVDATPKVSALPKPPGLPQTGQLRWPIPVLTLSGIILIGLSSRGKKP